MNYFVMCSMQEHDKDISRYYRTQITRRQKTLKENPLAFYEHHVQAGLHIKHTLSRASWVAHQLLEGCASDNVRALPLI